MADEASAVYRTFSLPDSGLRGNLRSALLPYTPGSWRPMNHGITSPETCRRGDVRPVPTRAARGVVVGPLAKSCKVFRTSGGSPCHPATCARSKKPANPQEGFSGKLYVRFGLGGARSIQLSYGDDWWANGSVTSGCAPEAVGRCTNACGRWRVRLKSCNDHSKENSSAYPHASNDQRRAASRTFSRC